MKKNDGELPPKIDIDCPQIRLGSKMCGWFICPRGLDEKSVIYSLGVGEDTSFDQALIKDFSVTIHAFDPTPKAINWVKTHPLSPKFILHEYGVADFDGEAFFNPPVKPDHVSHTIINRPETSARAIRVPVKCLSTIMKELGHRQINLLKMDIEGAEYGVIEDMVKAKILPDQLLVEFHHRFPGIGIERTRAAIKILKSQGYKIFSITPKAEEFSFIYQP